MAYDTGGRVTVRRFAMIHQMTGLREWRWTTAVARVVDDEARWAYPDECCGWLLGPGAGLVTAVASAANEEGAAQSRMRYLMTAHSYRQAEARASGEGLQIVGVYHSHPDHPARPSATDLAEAWPSWLYVIVPVTAGTPGEARAWTLQDDRSGFAAVPIQPAD